MKFKVTNTELSRAYLGNPSFQKFIELEGELVEDKTSVGKEEDTCSQDAQTRQQCNRKDEHKWITNVYHPYGRPQPSVELPRELPEFSLDTEEERDQYASISINRRAINQLIRYLKAKGI